MLKGTVVAPDDHCIAEALDDQQLLVAVRESGEGLRVLKRQDAVVFAHLMVDTTSGVRSRGGRASGQGALPRQRSVPSPAAALATALELGLRPYKSGSPPWLSNSRASRT